LFMFIAYSLIKFQDHGHRKKTQAILAFNLLYTQNNLLREAPTLSSILQLLQLRALNF